MAPHTFALEHPTAAHDVPELMLLIAANAVQLMGDDVVGRASDGSEVTLGSLESTEELSELHEFLRNYPTPDTW